MSKNASKTLCFKFNLSKKISSIIVRTIITLSIFFIFASCANASKYYGISITNNTNIAFRIYDDNVTVSGNGERYTDRDDYLSGNQILPNVEKALLVYRSKGNKGGNTHVLGDIRLVGFTQTATVSITIHIDVDKLGIHPTECVVKKQSDTLVNAATTNFAGGDTNEMSGRTGIVMKATLTINYNNNIGNQNLELKSIGLGNIGVTSTYGKAVNNEKGVYNLDQSKRYHISFSKTSNHCTVILGEIKCPSSIGFTYLKSKDQKNARLVFICQEINQGDAYCPWVISNNNNKQSIAPIDYNLL
ncbi:hypothetical protein L3V83_05520 [Thiotrichales bacterium 19X7-9]|nr:hypothetical protein [Thiotrichales bacterium 19X7-9]